MHKEKIPVAREGVPFIGIAALALLVFALLNLLVPALLSLVAFLFVMYFFRDPERITPSDKDLIVSPADGRVVEITSVDKVPFFDKSFEASACRKVGIFMNVFDVHVNRMPVSGRVLDVEWMPGSFMAADRLKASLENERCALLVQDIYKKKVLVVQVAGLIARRIVCRAEPGDVLSVGQRYGMIRFGSRVDLYLPQDFTISVKEGDRVIAGQSIIGKCSSED